MSAERRRNGKNFVQAAVKILQIQIILKRIGSMEMSRMLTVTLAIKTRGRKFYLLGARPEVQFGRTVDRAPGNRGVMIWLPGMLSRATEVSRNTRPVT